MPFEMSIHFEELRKRKIFVASPQFGGMCTGSFCKSTADLSAIAVKYGIDLKLFFLFNESLIPRARNYLADEFLRDKSYTHLMFIDADIGYDPNDVISLAAIAAPGTDKHIVCGPYPKKCLSNAAKVITPDGKMTISKL